MFFLHVFVCNIVYQFCDNAKCSDTTGEIDITMAIVYNLRCLECLFKVSESSSCGNFQYIDLVMNIGFWRVFRHVSGLIFGYRNTQKYGTCQMT